MKKLWISLAAVALVMALGVTGALAAGHRGQGLRYTAAGGCGINCVNFADADGDGICDYRGTGCGVCYTDTDGAGICDYRGTGCGACYTDTDGDGVCDHYGTGLSGGHHGGWGGCRKR